MIIVKEMLDKDRPFRIRWQPDGSESVRYQILYYLYPLC